jgi:hypothetical protein
MPSVRCILARPTDEAADKLLSGAEANLIRNIHGIAEVALSARKTNRIRNVALAN